MEQDRVVLEDRLSNLERQISVFERMVHMLSGSLDHRFKRYDMIICSQQQQISELNAVLSTFLNDEYRHAEVLREKLTGTLHGISATAASIGSTIHSDERYVAENASRPLDPDSIFGDILGDDGPQGLPRNSDKQSHTRRHDEQRGFSRGFDDANAQQQGRPLGKPMARNDSNNSGGHNNGNNNHTNNKSLGNNGDINNSSTHSNGNANKNMAQQDDHHQLAILSYGDFGHIPNSDKTNPNNTLNATNGQPQFYNDPRANDGQLRHPSNSNESDQHSDGQSQPNNSGNDLGGDLKEEQYITNKGRKRKRSVYIGSFQFLKSPHSVMEVWKEYTEGINGQPSIREMETIYQTGWRRDPAVNKRYSRRKVLCKAIETGLARGYSLDYIVNLLEDYRYINREKGLKQPIGWICQGQNIPESLR